MRWRGRQRFRTGSANFAFTYLPDAGTLVRGQGEEMAIPGKDFADALFSVWLGPNPTDRALKRKLLGQ